MPALILTATGRGRLPNRVGPFGCSDFFGHRIGLAEWAVLRAIRQAKGGVAGNLALIRQVDISRQRLRDLLRSLEYRKMV